MARTQWSDRLQYRVINSIQNWCKMSSKIMHGIVNGRTIELAAELGVPAGQEVEVIVNPLPPDQSTWGAGLRRCAGALAAEWTDEDDRILDEIHRERKHDRRAEPME